MGTNIVAEFMVPLCLVRYLTLQGQENISEIPEIRGNVVSEADNSSAGTPDGRDRKWCSQQL